MPHRGHVTCLKVEYMIHKETILEYLDVNISKGAELILEHLNIQITSGEFVYLMGRVGAGKSTLLQTIYADASISGSRAQVCGYNLLKPKRGDIVRLRRNLGIIFQKPELLIEKTAFENLDIVLKAFGISSKRQRIERIEEVLSWVGLDLKSYKYPHELSGGEQQRLSIARSLLGSPKLILADEPTAHLNQEMAYTITELLHQLSQEHGMAVIMATHNQRLIDLYQARVIDLDNLS